MGSSHLSGPLYIGGMPAGMYGIPAVFDNKVIYVDADNGADGRDGLTPEKAKATVEAGYAELRTNRHDVLVLSANGSHTLEDELVITKNRIHIISADFDNRRFGRAVKINLGVTTGSAIAAINDQGVRNHFRGLKVTSSDTLATSLYGIAEAGEFALWELCEILKTTHLDQTGAAEMLCVGDSAQFNLCTFGNQIYRPSVARQNVLFTRGLSPTSNVSRDLYFDHCWFLGFPSATTFVNLRATTNDIERLAYFNRCLFANKAGAAAQALVCGIASALTDAHMILHDCAVQNITDVAAGSSGVYTTSPTPSATGTETVEVTTS